jgi:malonate-semialdehyde dehydrogenase (acetylating) / methylmalonate-semialdehyde dehydrogenase
MTDALASADVRTLENYVGGRWTPVAGAAAPADRAAAAAASLDSRDPSTGDLLARVPLSAPGDVDAAVAAARDAFPGWAATSVLVRARALFAFRAALDAAREELARIVALDMGKTLDDARGEVNRGIESVEAACAAPHLLKGETLEGVGGGVDVEMIRQPVGVVAAITPFNFPAMIPLWFVPYALACGNTVVLKPSERDPLASQRIVELGSEIFPPGVLNLVHGDRTVVDHLLDHAGVDAVSFVGSAHVARHVYARAAAAGKRVQALGGAKNAMVVMPDADPAVVAAGVTSSAFGAGGQRCLAGSVAVLVGSKEEQDASLDVILRASAKEEATPLVDAAARERVESEIGEAERAGDRVLADGRLGGGVSGAFLGATVLEPIDREGRLSREELFGPVLSIVRADTLTDAIAWMNASRYGNAAVIFTRSGGAARQFRATVEAGMLGVNVGVAAPVAWFPFSGWKDSMAGDLHANGRDAIEFFTRKKVVTTRW